MVQYATEAELFDLGVPSDAFASLPSAVLVSALVWASSVANSYLKKRYELPLLSYGEDLRSAVVDIAKWRLIKRRGFNPNSGQDAVIADAYKDAIAWLGLIARGDCELDGVVDSTESVDEAGPLVSSGNAESWNFFTRGRDCE